MPSPTLIHVAVALVWLYQGLWCKLLGRLPHQRDVIAAVPFFSPGFAHGLLLALGAIETAFGIWELSGWLPYSAAFAQTLLLVGMNSGGVLWARRHIHDPAGMLLMNFAFLVLIWTGAAIT